MKDNSTILKVFMGFILFAGMTISCEKPIKEEPPVTEVEGKESERTPLTISSTEVYTTAHGTDLKLSQTGTVSFDKFIQPLETEASILVNTDRLHQDFVGIGAALTDAAAETFYKLDKDQQDLFMEAYYSIDKGIGYSLSRTIIHSCDFSSGSYTYIEEGDAELKTFNIDHDRKYRLPFTKKAIEAAGGDLLMFASPWSPPAFMKTNGNMLQNMQHGPLPN